MARSPACDLGNQPLSPPVFKGSKVWDRSSLAQRMRLDETLPGNALSFTTPVGCKRDFLRGHPVTCERDIL